MLYPFVYILSRLSKKYILRMFVLIYMMEYVGLSPAGSIKRKNKVDQDGQENPDDLREPSAEENERLFSTLEYELPVDDIKDVPDTQNTTGERKLIRIDKRSEFELIQSSLRYLDLIRCNIPTRHITVYTF